MTSTLTSEASAVTAAPTASIYPSSISPQAIVAGETNDQPAPHRQVRHMAPHAGIVSNSPFELRACSVARKASPCHLAALPGWLGVDWLRSLGRDPRSQRQHFLRRKTTQKWSDFSLFTQGIFNP